MKLYQYKTGFIQQLNNPQLVGGNGDPERMERIEAMRKRVENGDTPLGDEDKYPTPKKGKYALGGSEGAYVENRLYSDHSDIARQIRVKKLTKGGKPLTGATAKYNENRKSRVNAVEKQMGLVGGMELLKRLARQAKK